MSGVRIAHFCDSHPGRPDGVTRSAAMTVRLLRAAGHEVDFYHPGPLLGRDVRSVPVPFRQVRVGLPFRPRPADLVHTHTCGPIGMTGFRAAAQWGVPLVSTWHTDLLAYADVFPEIPAGAAWCALRLELGWSPREFRELTRAGAVRRGRLVELGKALFARMAVAIAPSVKTAEGFAVFEPAGEVCVLPTPVVGGPAPRGRPLGHVGPRDRNVVLSVGRGTAEKNPELLLRAFAGVRAVRPQARLVLLGVRQQRRRLERLIAELGLRGCVEVLPPVPHEQVAGFYRRADVLAFASVTDTQSLVLAEAEAAGLPVVVADAGLGIRPGPAGELGLGPAGEAALRPAADAGLRRSGDAGPGPAGDAGPGPAGDAGRRFTCEPAPEAFAAGLLRMLADEELRARVRGAGLAAAAAYSPEVFLERLVQIYGRASR